MVDKDLRSDLRKLNLFNSQDSYSDHRYRIFMPFCYEAGLAVILFRFVIAGVVIWIGYNCLLSNMRCFA